MSDNSKALFDEIRLSELVLAWQKASQARQAAIWREIVEKTANYLIALIRSFKGDLGGLGTHEEIRAELVLKLHRVLSHFRPGRGRLFSLVTVACLNHLRTLIEKNQRLSRRYVMASEHGQEIGAAVLPDIYGLGTEIRERLDHFRAPGDDFEGFLVRNLVVYSLWERGGKVVPSLEQIAGIVEEIVSLPAERALSQTREALELLRKELADFRGRPSLYRNGSSAQERRDAKAFEAEPNRDCVDALDFSWQ